MVHTNLEDLVLTLLGSGLASHPSGKAAFILCHFILDVCNFLFDFRWHTSKRLAWVSKGTLNFGIFIMLGLVRLHGLVKF